MHTVQWKGISKKTPNKIRLKYKVKTIGNIYTIGIYTCHHGPVEEKLKKLWQPNTHIAA